MSRMRSPRHHRVLRRHARHRLLDVARTALGIRLLPGRAQPRRTWSVMLSIVATETSALTVISIPGLGARGDLTFLQLPIGYLFGRIGVAIGLRPGYFRGEQETAYARLETRFGAPTRRMLSLVFLVTRFLGDGVRVFAGAIPLSLLTGWSVPTAILVLGAITLFYTYIGGIKAVIWADVVQLCIYVAGGVAALVIATRLAGGAGHAWSMAAASRRAAPVQLPAFAHDAVHFPWRIDWRRAAVGRIARDRSPDRAATARDTLAAGCAHRDCRLRCDRHPAISSLPAGRRGALGLRKCPGRHRA